VKIHFYNAAGGLAGRMTFTGQPGQNDRAFDFSGFAPGVYYMLAQNGNQRRPLAKFAVIR